MVAIPMRSIFAYFYCLCECLVSSVKPSAAVRGAGYKVFTSDQICPAVEHRLSLIQYQYDGFVGDVSQRQNELEVAGDADLPRSTTTWTPVGLRL
eukprot:4958760-Pyramimonas_sp.AAC.1